MPDARHWRGIALAEHVITLEGRVYRVVESQEQVATVNIVDTLEEQSVLEQLLEHSKPAPRPGSDGLHYLLFSPFRYPPLRHGSRFGGRHEPSIFYGSHRPRTARAEAAYYRFVFWFGMSSPPKRPMRSEHTLYTATYQAQSGLKLQAEPFVSHRKTLTDPADYQPTQALGTAMRAVGILAFEFSSARDENAGTNAGLFDPSAFASPNVANLEQWLCEIDGEVVRFLGLSTHAVERYPLKQFLVDGQLPAPAT